jgi:hypothetical protein
VIGYGIKLQTKKKGKTDDEKGFCGPLQALSCPNRDGVEIKLSKF